MEEENTDNEDSSTYPENHNQSAVSFNAHAESVRLSSPQIANVSNTNLQSLLSSPFTSLRSLTRRSKSKEFSQSISETSLEEGIKEIDLKKTEHSIQTNAIERRNLLNMVKLSVKNLIESSTSLGHTLDNDNRSLEQFFIVIENILQHQLKGSKRFFAQNKSFWPVIEIIERFHSSAGPITDSVRSLPGIKTFVGKGRAWIRLAVMQKKLAEYFQVFIDKRESFKEWYENDGFLLNDEAAIMLGHLVGLNCIDANICVKELDLDNQITTIDLSLYVDDEKNYTKNSENIDKETVTQKLLDQKNYLEERNRFLETSLIDLNKKLEVLEKTNLSQNDELKKYKSKLENLQTEATKISIEKSALERNSKQQQDAWRRSKLELDEMLNELNNQLKQETALRLDVEKELQHQMSLKQELELAMKIQDQDLNFKQQGLVALRDQLDNVKVENADMYLKLQALSESDDQNNNEKLRSEVETLKAQVLKLTENLDEAQRQVDIAREQADRYNNQLDDSEKARNVLSTNLNIERDWRESLLKDKDKNLQDITLLQEKMEMMLSMKEELEKVTKERDFLRQFCNDRDISTSPHEASS